MSAANIVVFDDVSDLASSWAAQIRTVYAGADVVTAELPEFTALLEELYHRRSRSRDQTGYNADDWCRSIDEMDVVIVDYDLLKYSTSADTTGARLAYLLRCYTKCGPIIVLNQYGRNSFDFRLGSPYRGFADLHVGDLQLSNPGLWSRFYGGYRPWHWPVIGDAIGYFAKCVEDLHNGLDKPILDFFGLRTLIDWLPQRARKLLSERAPLETVTFAEFVRSPAGGVSAKDELISEQIGRVVAARIRTLLNSVILPEQSLFVDAPHLISRFPSLLLNAPDSIESWNQVCNPTKNGDVSSLLDSVLQPYAFSASHWFGRPTWFWPAVAKDEDIAEVRDPWTVRKADWVFCENVSQFVPIRYTREFGAQVSSPFVRRFLFDIQSAGAEGFAKARGWQAVGSFSDVEYTPQVAFSL